MNNIDGGLFSEDFLAAEKARGHAQGRKGTIASHVIRVGHGDVVRRFKCHDLRGTRGDIARATDMDDVIREGPAVVDIIKELCHCFMVELMSFLHAGAPRASVYWIDGLLIPICALGVLNEKPTSVNLFFRTGHSL